MLCQDFADLRASEGPAPSRPVVALNPTDRPQSPIIVGDPAAAIDYLSNDVAVAQAGGLMIFLPPSFTHAENVELLENIAAHIAGQLGWVSAG